MAQGLLFLSVVAADDAHEGGGDDTFDEAEEEPLGEEAAVGRHGCGEHGDEAPEDDGEAEDFAEVEALQGEC